MYFECHIPSGIQVHYSLQGGANEVIGIIYQSFIAFFFVKSKGIIPNLISTIKFNRAATRYFKQCGMSCVTSNGSDQTVHNALPQSDQSLCYSLEYSMSVSY